MHEQVSTEGDAFLIVFHDPADAVAYTIATQQVRTRHMMVHDGGGGLRIVAGYAQKCAGGDMHCAGFMVR